MLKVLVKKQLLEIFQGFYIDRRSGKVRQQKGIMSFFILIIFLGISLGMSFYAMANSFGNAILGHEFNWLYFSLTGVISITFGLFGSIFSTYSSLYAQKDNELLLSLPIPTRTILFARLIGVYSTSLLYSAWIWIPVLIAYWLVVPLNAFNITFPILLTFVIALFVTVLSCALGWIVALIASKAKGKSILTVLLSVLGIGAYYVIYSKVANSLAEITNHLGEIGNGVKFWAYYLYILGRAADGDITSMILIVAITTILAAICFFILNKTFIRIATSTGTSSKKIKGDSNYTKKSIKKALLHREYKHFASVSTWMLNGGFGLIMLLVVAVSAVVKSSSLKNTIFEISREVPELYAFLPIALMVSACLIISTSIILPVSISIEGKSFWQLKSLPIETWDIFKAKERMYIQLAFLPAILFTVVCGIVLGLQWYEIVLISCAVVIFTFVIAEFGLYLNLKMPNFNWTNVTALVKQSMPVVINMFGGWAFCIAMAMVGFGILKFVDIRTILFGYVVLFGGLWWGLRRWLKTRGVEIFSGL